MADYAHAGAPIGVKVCGKSLQHHFHVIEFVLFDNMTDWGWRLQFRSMLRCSYSISQTFLMANRRFIGEQLDISIGLRGSKCLCVYGVFMVFALEHLAANFPVYGST